MATNSLSTTTLGSCAITAASSIPTSAELFISILTTATTSSTTSPTLAPLYLSVNPSPGDPDPLGIGLVRAFYGPGAWAAWFLTVVASWIGLCRSHHANADLNTWMFLLGTNWAAGDLVMQVYSVCTLERNGNRAGLVPSDMGRLAAAYSVIWMGCWHATTQLIIFPTMHAHDLKLRRLSLIIGLVLPLSSLSIGFLVKRSSDNFPVFYWQGLDSEWHNAFILCASLAPAWAVGTLIHYIQRWNEERPNLEYQRAPNPLADMRLPIFALLTGFGYLFDHNLAVRIVICILSILLFSDVWALGGLLSICLGVPILSVIYIFKAYFHLGSGISQSCFFMPCSLRRIYDSDQARSLVSGIVAVTTFAIGPLIYRTVRNFFDKFAARRHSIQWEHQNLKSRDSKVNRLFRPAPAKNGPSNDSSFSLLAKYGLSHNPTNECRDRVTCRRCGAVTERWKNREYGDSPNLLPWFHKESCRYHPKLNSKHETVKEVYRGLDANRSELRILRLLPQVRQQIIECTLETHQLDEKLQYEALSYNWGDLCSAPPFFILINGHLWRVNRNLYFALSRLRHATSIRTLWVDALCINQYDDTEKTYQVTMMRKIYSHSQPTLIWLGEPILDVNGLPPAPEQPILFEGTEAVDQIVQDFESANIAFDEAADGSIHSTFEVGKTCGCCRDQTVYENLEEKHYMSAICFLYHIWKGHHLRDIPYLRQLRDANYEHSTIWRHTLLALNAIILFPWWERIWVVQEVQLSSKRVVHMGRFQFPFQMLLSAFSWLEAHRLSCCSDVFLSFPILHGKVFDVLFDRMRPFAVSERITFENLTSPVLRFMERKATDPRDMIFGLMGLMSDRYQKQLQSLSPGLPDYSLTLLQTFKLATFIMLQEQCGSRILALCQRSASERLGLPTWVPAWSSIDALNRFWCGFAMSYNASNGLAKGPECAGNFLTVANYGVDRVRRVGIVANGFNDGSKVMEILKEWRSLAGIGDSDRKHCRRRPCPLYRKGCSQATVEAQQEAFYRTLTADLAEAPTKADEKAARAQTAQVQKIKDLLDWGEMHPERFRIDKLDEKFTRTFVILVGAITARRFFVTSNGFYGLGPPETSEGDEVRVIFGSEVPFVVRPVHSLYHWRHNCCSLCRTGQLHDIESDGNMDSSLNPDLPHLSYVPECVRTCFKKRVVLDQNAEQPYEKLVALFVSTWMKNPSLYDRFSKAMDARIRAFRLGMEFGPLSDGRLPQACYTHSLIGACYLHGIMDGEALTGYTRPLEENIELPSPTKYDRIILG